ncbi:MAG: CBS domain-containing protein [Gemmatimonadota bacterium]
MKIRDILSAKGHGVVTASPRETVLSAMRTLVEHNIGAVVIMEEGAIVGILSERDVLRLGARSPEALAETSVGEAMTRELVVGVPDDDVHYAMGVMTQNRVRHLPIVHDDRLEGIVSIGDLVNACRKAMEVENRYLRDYIQGAAY